LAFSFHEWAKDANGTHINISGQKNAWADYDRAVLFLQMTAETFVAVQNILGVYCLQYAIYPTLPAL
jgi:hypothetical protein